METTLHRQLKSLYAADPEQKEVALGRYRIDAIDDAGRLVEVQCAGLGAIRSKIGKLVRSHDVVVIKPVVATRLLVKRNRKRGRIVSQRRSPSRGRLVDVFEELVHFVTVFPHDRLALEVAVVDIEEHRLPPRSKRRFHRRYRVEDRVLLAVNERITLQRPADLGRLLPTGFPQGSFTTSELAEQNEIPRWLAQKAAYCLRKTGAAAVVGKKGNAIVYEVDDGARKAA